MQEERADTSGNAEQKAHQYRPDGTAPDEGVRQANVPIFPFMYEGGTAETLSS
ncbi:hypothetical protein JCM15764A_05970 [Geotalea toluenoxydans]